MQSLRWLSTKVGRSNNCIFISNIFAICTCIILCKSPLIFEWAVLFSHSFYPNCIQSVPLFSTSTKNATIRFQTIQVKSLLRYHSNNTNSSNHSYHLERAWVLSFSFYSLARHFVIIKYQTIKGVLPRFQLHRWICETLLLSRNVGVIESSNDYYTFLIILV